MVRTYCRTYNHEKYILDALDGFAMQQTDFPVVTTIVEDCSTDNTAGVIRKYLNDYFALNDTMVAYEKETDYAIIVFSQHKTNKNCFFAVLFLKYNHWRLKKSVFPYIEEWSNNSKYYAICEGDDYWIDPKKLQIQVGFMENNPEYGLVYSMAKVYDTMTNTFSNNLMGKETTSFESLFFANDIPTATTCFKAELFNQYLNVQ